MLQGQQLFATILICQSIPTYLEVLVTDTCDQTNYQKKMDSQFFQIICRWQYYGICPQTLLVLELNLQGNSRKPLSYRASKKVFFLKSAPNHHGMCPKVISSQKVVNMRQIKCFWFWKLCTIGEISFFCATAIYLNFLDSYWFLQYQNVVPIYIPRYIWVTLDFWQDNIWPLGRPFCGPDCPKLPFLVPKIVF